MHDFRRHFDVIWGNSVVTKVTSFPKQRLERKWVPPTIHCAQTVMADGGKKEILVSLLVSLCLCTAKDDYLTPGYSGIRSNSDLKFRQPIPCTEQFTPFYYDYIS